MKLCPNGSLAFTKTFDNRSTPIEGMRMTSMIDEKLARLRAHRNNISRYRGLLKTKLTEIEREFIGRRLSQEQLALESLAGSALTFKVPSAALASPPIP